MGVLTAAVVNNRPWPEEGAEPCHHTNVFPILGVDEPELTEEEDAQEQRQILRMYATR